MTKDFYNVRVSADEMEAFLTLAAPPEETDGYTVEEVMTALKQENICYGIDETAIQEMLDRKDFGETRLIARGTGKKDGRDGFFDFKFNNDVSFKPKEHGDGTVDYFSLHVVEVVQEGQVVIEYHEAIPAEDGTTVTGKNIPATRGRNLPPLLVRGVEKSQDGKTYTALFTGKIEMNNNRVVVSKVYEIHGDVDMTTGNIDFQGDVVVHGNVISSMKINATGTVTVDGIVEAAVISAGKDVLIRGGVVGAYKASIASKGNLIARFLEYATVNVSGSIETDSLVNCNVKSNDHIYMSGRHAKIVGGIVYAACGMDLYSIGSGSGTVTKVIAGMEMMQLQLIEILQTELKDIEDKLAKIEKALPLFSAPGADPQKRLLMLRTKIQLQSDQNEKKRELEELLDLKERSQFPCIRVIRDVFPGVSVTIGTETVNISDAASTVEFRENNHNLRMYSIAAN